jgi:hypothetical protein
MRFASSIVGSALLAVVALAGADGSSARVRSVEPKLWGSDWTASATNLVGQSGSRFEYVCPAYGRLDQVWGTNVYTDDSSVCTAAVQAGLITVADGGLVTIEHLPGQPSYTGSTANGVTSNGYGSWTGSFQLIGADKGGSAAGVKMGGGSWTANAITFQGKYSSKFLFICPAGGRIGTVWGTNIYTDDSSVCTAAVQVGLLTAANGGETTIEMRPGQNSYTSFKAHGVTTASYGSWTGSFVFAGAALIPGSPGAGGGGGGGGSGGGGSTTTTTTTSSATSSPPPTATAKGTVTVDGAPFTGGTIRYNSTVDVTNGSVLLKTTTGTLTVTGASGITAAFVLLRGIANKKPVVVLRLAKGSFSVCPKRKKASAGLASAAPTVVRQLWGNGKGSFQTRGRYAAATVRGTHWLTADRCDGTLTKVLRGVVQVNDLPKHTTVTVPAGHSYLAKP